MREKKASILLSLLGIIGLVLAIVLFTILIQYTSKIKPGAAVRVVERAESGVQQNQPPADEAHVTPTGESTAYVYGKSLVARKDARGISYSHQDLLSSNRFSTDPTGKLTS